MTKKVVARAIKRFVRLKGNTDSLPKFGQVMVVKAEGRGGRKRQIAWRNPERSLKRDFARLPWKDRAKNLRALIAATEAPVESSE